MHHCKNIHTLFFCYRRLDCFHFFAITRNASPVYDCKSNSFSGMESIGDQLYALLTGPYFAEFLCNVIIPIDFSTSGA